MRRQDKSSADIGGAVAQALGVARAALFTLLNEHASLSPEMALRVEKACGVSMDTLMRMQNSYDIARARRCEGEIKVARSGGTERAQTTFAPN